MNPFKFMAEAILSLDGEELSFILRAVAATLLLIALVSALLTLLVFHTEMGHQMALSLVNWVFGG